MAFVAEPKVPQASSAPHTVTEDARNLGDIAVFLYGDGKMYLKIAKWNNIPSPYVVHLGQKLILLEKPLLTSEEGSAKLLEVWRARFNIFIDDQTISPEEKKARENFVAKLRETEKIEKAVASVAAVPEVKAPNAKEELAHGQRLFDAQAYETATQHFKKAREIDPDLVTSWFYEIVALRMLKKDEDAKATAKLLLDRKPMLSGIPMFKKMFK